MNLHTGDDDGLATRKWLGTVYGTHADDTRHAWSIDATAYGHGWPNDGHAANDGAWDDA